MNQTDTDKMIELQSLLGEAESAGLFNMLEDWEDELANLQTTDDPVRKPETPEDMAEVVGYLVWCRKILAALRGLQGDTITPIS